MTEVWELTTDDFDAPDVGTVWDLCLTVEYDREQVVADMTRWLGPPNGQRVLDAACGSGFPALELHQLGYKVSCTDGSPPMLDRFRRNAAVAGIELEAEQALWQELGKRYPEQFDVVICRGCSLLYAGTFDEDADPDRAAVEASIQSFADCLRPGGRIYVDVPREENLGEPEAEWNVHAPRTIDGRRVELRERITADPEARLRRWEVKLEIDDKALELERRSHYMPHAELLAMISAAGLEDASRADLPSEHYAVLTGRKP